MEYLVGVALACGVAAFAGLTGLDRERAFYPTVLIVVASYYVLFAAMEGGASALGGEAVVMALFTGAAVIGFRTRPWIIAAALFAHGVFDAVHSRIVPNPLGPDWWPMFCLAFDGALAILLVSPLRARGGAVARNDGLPSR